MRNLVCFQCCRCLAINFKIRFFVGFCRSRLIFCSLYVIVLWMCWYFLMLSFAYSVSVFLCLLILIVLDWVAFSCPRMRFFTVHCFWISLVILAVSFALLVSCRLTRFGFYCILICFWRCCLAFFCFCISVSRLAFAFLELLCCVVFCLSPFKPLLLLYESSRRKPGWRFTAGMKSILFVF